MKNEKNQHTTTITVKVTTTLKQVIKIIAKDLKVTPNEFIEGVLAQSVAIIVDKAREAHTEATKEIKTTEGTITNDESNKITP